MEFSPVVFCAGIQKLRRPQIFVYFLCLETKKEKTTQLMQNIFWMRTKVLFVIMQWLYCKKVVKTWKILLKIEKTKIFGQKG